MTAIFVTCGKISWNELMVASWRFFPKKLMRTKKHDGICNFCKKKFWISILNFEVKHFVAQKYAKKLEKWHFF